MQYTLETKDGIKLATLRLTNKVETEMFWLAFNFAPFPEFENHRGIFDQWANNKSYDDLDLMYNILDQMNSQFQLTPVGNTPTATDFNLFIYGNIAIMRCVFGDTPLTPTRLDEKPTWELYHGEIVLGTLIEAEKDSPYIYCEFTPTTAFENVSSLFADELRALKNNDDSWNSYVAKIQNLRLRFAPMNSITSVVKADVLHIEGGKAWFRVIAEKEQ